MPPITGIKDARFVNIASVVNTLCNAVTTELILVGVSTPVPPFLICLEKKLLRH